ncbi:MAG TPA: TonB family protein [Thermoanaerobaculia bacterium]|nr:TonB family protein [Thermoanaerobaculia bacterium]
MHDRVGEILAARAAQGSGAAPALALSVVLHAALTGAAIYAAMHAPAPQTANILNITFRSISSFPTLAAPVAKPVQKPAEPKPATPKIVEPAPQVPVTTSAKAEPKTVPLSTFGKSTKKGSEHPTPAPPPPAPATPAATSTGIGIADVPIGGAGVTGLEGGDFPYTIYIENMKRLIGTKWFRPQIGGGIVTTVAFTIERDGTIRDAKVETPSGNGTFDRAALRAILEASPLPPLPFAYNGTYLGVHLTFK